MEAYPLHWPAGFPRTVKPKKSNFDVRPGQSKDLLKAEIARLGGTGLIISTNIRLRQDGFPYASQKEPEDTGVAVYFEHQGQQVVLACDKWNAVKDNMRAITKTVEAMRGLERWGVSDMLNRTFQGFKAIPESVTMPWEEVLGVSRHASQDEIKTKYRRLIKLSHPDKGGNEELFRKVQEAYQQAIRETASV